MTNDTPTTDAEANAQRDQIAKLNDQCRQAMGIAGKFFQTEGISALPCWRRRRIDPGRRF